MNVARTVCLSTVFASALAATGCTGSTPAAPAASPAPAPAPQSPSLSREDFNRAAVRLNLPLYWVEDRNQNRTPDADEIVSLRFYPSSPIWSRDGKLTEQFQQALAQIQQAATQPVSSDLPEGEQKRRALLVQELDQGSPTLVYTDLRNAPAAERTFASHMLQVAQLIDSLYARQNGLPALQGQLQADDTAGHSVFRRNWGPRCLAPKTEKNPACFALPSPTRQMYDAYPAELQTGPDFCSALEKRPDASKLLDPFVVIRKSGESFEPVPVTVAYADLTGQIAQELTKAASVLGDDEAALKAYLQAAARSFQTNDWVPADEAWARMNAQNSKWYVRVGPDEVYWDPCSRKAGFHLTFARINADSIAWQQKLTPVQQEMEQSLAALIGDPYKARTVTFHLPDFIDIVLNAGDDRHPMGATIGQSLPNWGPVANEGRGRTVAMSNLYTDADSMRVRKEQASSLLDASTMTRYAGTPEPGLLSTILHEATHNFGPSHEYRFEGKTDDQLFGGPLASTMEELKAQTGALWYIDLLKRKGIISAELAAQTYVDSVVWAMSHISRGMYTETGKPKPYSQLAVIHIGFLIDEQAARFDPQAPAANGTDKGALALDFDKLPAAIDKLMAIVGKAKATGDKQAAQKLIERYVDGKVVPQQLITERMLRHPKASFVYALEL